MWYKIKLDSNLKRYEFIQRYDGTMREGDAQYYSTQINFEHKDRTVVSVQRSVIRTSRFSIDRKNLSFNVYVDLSNVGHPVNFQSSGTCQVIPPPSGWTNQI